MKSEEAAETACGCLIAVLIVGLVILMIGFIVGIMSDETDLRRLREDMQSVGIEKFVRCNNTHSNWVEIVWKDEGK